MAKVPKAKKLSSSKSRAARRASSPVAIQEETKFFTGKRLREPIHGTLDALAAHHQTRISKKKKQKALSRKQRERKEKGMARADVVMDQLEKKTSKSKAKGKVIKHRRADWNDLNSAIKDPRSSKNPKVDLQGIRYEDSMSDIQKPQAEETARHAREATLPLRNQMQNLTVDGDLGDDEQNIS